MELKNKMNGRITAQRARGLHHHMCEAGEERERLVEFRHAADKQREVQQAMKKKKKTKE